MRQKMLNSKSPKLFKILYNDRSELSRMTTNCYNGRGGGEIVSAHFLFFDLSSVTRCPTGLKLFSDREYALNTYYKLMWYLILF